MSDDSNNNSSNDSSSEKRELSKSKSKNRDALSGSKQRVNSKGKKAETTGWSPKDGAGYIPTEEGGSGKQGSSDSSSSGDSSGSSSDE